ncbi:glycoside hydrolase family 68 protein [Qipengyuania sp. RANM35]|uniref:glycoside hydrolase family 68 protein n=1 Tax=Qipengyuania sp. RANM35 TaxID=3068635 RepID=UPI0034DB5BAB
MPEIPVIGRADARPAIDHLHLWDLWPIETFDGSIVRVDGAELWVIMSAPRSLHPDDRHHVARLRLTKIGKDGWSDLGDLLPEGVNPGAREWAGSTIYDPETGRLILFYTAAGRQGDTRTSYEQRLFQVEGRLIVESGAVRTGDWTTPFENIISDDLNYVVAKQADGKPGFIKAFRDPAHFRDPADGASYLLFTASLKQSASDFNGAIGIARASEPDLRSWELLPPLISADGLNNELERPVMRFVDGHYYVFWSTQRRVFAPDGPSGPNGLYGMVAESLFGPYRPINGTGLVACNPVAEPFQAYSWWVTKNLEVIGFVDNWGLEGRSLEDQPELVSSQFGGTPTPRFRLQLDGEKSEIRPL